jgi:predicted secreted protein
MIMHRLAIHLAVSASIMLGAGLALAGDYAERRIIGFSANGAYFAFEQFGVQDGSGFPYSDIFIVNIENDIWAGGSPFRVQLNDDTQGVNAARAASANMAASAIASLGIRDSGTLLASNPITESGANPLQVSFRPTPYFGTKWQLNLNEFPLSTSGCSGFEENIRGFSLTLTTEDGQPPRELHQDHSIPSSRKCPINYGISDVILHGNYNATSQLVVLVRVLSVGFEGPDMRYIAIPAIIN